MAPGGPLLVTKTLIPRRREDTLTRRRLLDALHQHIDRRLLLVIASAGSGKTTLLVDFAHEVDFPVGWYTLDPGDRDLKVFFTYLVEAVRRRFPGFGQQTSALLEHVKDPAREIPSLVAAFVNDLYADVQDFFTLVIDDYHCVDESPLVNQAVDELLRFLPENVRLVLSSRTIPRITLSRLAARLQVFGLGMVDLRFTGDEVRHLVKLRNGLLLLPDQADELAERCEGWATGILLTMQADWQGLVGNLPQRSTQWLLFDYLVTEVYGNLSPTLQDFLLRSSVPLQFDLAQLEALLGPGAWEARVEEAEREGLFLSRLGEEGRWFRYHQLFREFLQARLRRERPEEYEALHRAAARWAESRGDWATAREHWRAIGDAEEELRLVRRAAGRLVEAGQWQTVADWIEALPREVVQADPELLLQQARVLWRLGDLDQALARVGEACQKASESGEDRQTARALLLRAAIHQCRSELAHVIHDCTQALEIAGHDDSIAAAVYRSLGAVLGVQGSLDDSYAHLRKAIDLATRAGESHAAAIAQQNLGVTCVRMGKLEEAASAYAQAHKILVGVGDPVGLSEVLVCQATPSYLRGNYDEALGLLEQALDVAGRAGYLRVRGYALHSKGDILRDLGRFSEARTCYEEGLTIARRLGETVLVAMYLDSVSTWHRRQGQLDEAVRLAEEALGLAEEHGSTYEKGAYGASLAAALLEKGQVRQAERRLGRCRRLLEAVGHRQDLARVHLFLALVYCRQGEERRARRHLQRMADLVEALGYSHFLHPELARMPELSALATRAGMALPFVAPRREDVPGARPAALATMQPIPTARLPEVRAQAFGTIQVWRDGRPLPGIEWRSQKAEELFFYLLVHGSAHKEQVMEALWPDSDPGRAQTNLHTSAYRVRRAIHPSAVLFERGRYLINPDLPCWHDAAAFDALLEEARRLPRGSAERIDLLRRAVDLYRGPYLPGWYADWCEERRRYYEERCLSSLVEVAGYHRARGEHAESLAFYQRVLDIDPLHDEVHERVIEAYLTLGDGISALHHYQRYVDLLRRELGVEPGPRLAALHRRITRGDAVAR